MLKHWKRTLSLLAVAAAVGLVSAGLALGKKPPKPPPEPPPPEPVVTVSYSIRFLGTLPGDTTSRAEDLNIHGEVVGYSYSPGLLGRAFLYSDMNGDGIKEMVALNDLMSDADRGQWDLTIAEGINDARQIAGSGYFNGECRAFRLTPGVGGEPAVVENLGTLGGTISAHGINARGDVTGGSYTSYCSCGWPHAFIWTEEGGMTDIGDLDGRGASSQHINNRGETTGWSRLKIDDVILMRAFRYTPAGGMENLGDFGAYEKRPLPSQGYDINDNGYVVGYAGNLPKEKGNTPTHAFLYTDHMIDLGTLGGYRSYAFGINSFCHVVGTSSTKDDPTTHGFLYTDITDTGDFVMVKLEDLILVLPPGYQGPIGPWKINDLGQICGEADGQAVLLTPLP